MMDDLNLSDEMADWTDLDLWGQSLMQMVCEELIDGMTATKFSYGGTMIISDTDPLTGERWEEKAMLCDTDIERLNWLEKTDSGKAFHKRLQSITENPIFFRNREKSI